MNDSVSRVCKGERMEKGATVDTGIGIFFRDTTFIEL